MTGLLKGAFTAIKNFLSPSESTPLAEAAHYPPRQDRPSSYLGPGAVPLYANNNYTNSAHRNHTSSTLQSSYYNSNNHWPPIPKPPSANSNSYPIAGKISVLPSILENNNCRKRSADFAFKNYQNHTASNSFASKRGSDLSPHLTDDEDDDIAKPSAKRFLPSFSKTSNFYSVNNSRANNCNSKSGGVPGTSALNHTGFNHLNNSSTSASAFSSGLGIPFPSFFSASTSAAAAPTSMGRPITRFTTAPKYQKKNPKKEPECITISSDDDIDTEDVQEPQSLRATSLHSQSQSQSSHAKLRAAAASQRQAPSTRQPNAKEPARVPHLYSTQTRTSTPPAYQKRTSIAGSTAATASSHGLSSRSSYFPSMKVNAPQQRQAPFPGTNSLNHKSANASVNANPRVRHSIGGENRLRSQPRAIMIGDTDDSESGSEANGVDVTKVDKACGPDGPEDPLKTRTELLFGRSPTTIPLRRNSGWGDKLTPKARHSLEQGALSKSLFSGSGSGSGTSPTQNGDMFAYGTRSRSSSVVSTGSTGNGDSTRAVGSRGSSSSFSISSGIDGRQSQQASGMSTPRSPISMSTKNDPKFFQDVQILCERIVSPPQRRDWHAVNSLELEMGQVQARDKGWLVQLLQEYQDKTSRNQAEIDFEYKKIDILRQESTLNTDIEEKIRRQLTITDVITLEPVPAVLPEISEDMEKVINYALRMRNDAEVLVTAFNIQITRADLKTLKPCQWLNDNVINTYMDMIAERAGKTPSLPSVHVFTTFFYPKFAKEGYSNMIKRWTRKVDIFSFDLLIFPIHLGVHWCLATADFRKKEIKFFDSLLGRHMNIIKALLQYLASEMQERKKQPLNTSEWSLDVPKDIPTQENGSDCGVFSCKFAEYASRDAPFTFKQENMDYYRSRMVYEIIKQDLMHP